MVLILRRVIRCAVGWLTFAIVGLLAYALLRALAAVIYLGVPIFDWQWYIPVIVLSVVIPLCLVFRWLRPQTKRPGKSIILIFAGLFGWVLLGFNGFDQIVQLQPNDAPPVPISFWAFSDFRQVPDSVLKDLKVAGGYIYLSIGDVSKPDNADALTSAMRRLSDYGIEVYLAPSLSNFLSVPVYQEWITRTQQTAALVQRERLTNVRGLIGDAEVPLNMPLDWLGTAQPAFDRTVGDMHEALDDLHRQYPELQFGVTAGWPQFVDVLDNDSDLALLARSPVNPPGNWDFVNLMAYSSYYPLSWRDYYVYLHETADDQSLPRQSIQLSDRVGGCRFPRRAAA